LSNRCSIRSVPVGGDILDPDGDDVTTSKLAVDRQVEHGEVASAAFDLEFRSEWTRRVLGVAAALPRSAFPCSKALAFGTLGSLSFDPAWSYSLVSGEQIMCWWSGIVDATLRKSCIVSESKRSLKGPSLKVRGCVSFGMQNWL
jgi:hypothetical protein